MWITIGSLAIIIMLCVSRRWPLWIFIATLFVLITANDRLEVTRFGVEGSADRGSLRLSDLLWLMSLAGIVTLRSRLYLPRALPLSVLATLPFACFSFLLPLVGVMAGSGPLSYATVGFRYLQASSFALLAYLLCNRYGTGTVSRSLLTALFAAIVCHGVYAMIQVGYSLGWLGSEWVLPDLIFVEQHANAWFFYPRATGWHVNPNLLGTTAVAIGLSVWSAYVARYRLTPGAWTVLLLIVIVTTFSSGSRTALFGAIVALSALLATQLSPLGRYAKRSIRGASSLATLGMASIVAVGSILPTGLLDRYVRFADLFSEGIEADENFIGRIEQWQYFLETYLRDYPLGTGIPPGYLDDLAVDNLYVQTAVQGSLAYMLMFILFLVGAFWTGWEALKRSHTPSDATVSLSLMGWATLMAATSISTSQVLLFPLLWSSIGICWAIRRGK